MIEQQGSQTNVSAYRIMWLLQGLLLKLGLTNPDQHLGIRLNNPISFNFVLWGSALVLVLKFILDPHEKNRFTLKSSRMAPPPDAGQCFSAARVTKILPDMESSSIYSQTLCCQHKQREPEDLEHLSPHPVFLLSIKTESVKTILCHSSTDSNLQCFSWGSATERFLSSVTDIDLRPFLTEWWVIL